jgi:hypothetical protein
VPERLACRWIVVAGAVEAYRVEAEICRGALPDELPLLNPRGG